ncbi:MAG TPA: glycoside hydrolase family 9 protein [Edaphobacter sp.]
MNRRHLLRLMGGAGVALHPGIHAIGQLASSSSEDAPGGIFVNQVGYLPSSVKEATVRCSDATDGHFQVRSANGNRVVFKGSLGAAATDAASGDRIRIADFLKLHGAGMYRIEAAGLASDAFSIAPRAYASALRLTMRGYHGQRCGCAVDLGGGYSHPGCHHDGAYHATSGRSGPLENHGGWHDAGDYGRYIVNSGISTGTLLWAWEFYQPALRSLSLDIPESGGKIPDYLAEVRWNLGWMLQLQDTDGGVWHKQTSEKFSAFVMPQDDALTSYVIGTGAEPYKSTCATGGFAAVMAIAARCYGPYDAVFAQRCLAAARQAWAWAKGHPDVIFENPPGILTGGYGDKHCGDEVVWASAELWRTTGEAEFEQAFLAKMPPRDAALTIIAPDWANVISMAYWTYALAPRKGNAEVKERIRSATAKAAELLVARSKESGYGNTLALADYVWGSNGVAGNQSMLLLIADHFHRDKTMQSTALNNLHYMVGRNCHGVSWVTHLGVRPFEHPHHRPSVADKIAAPWPGLLSGGPNAHGGDVVANAMPKRPPMHMWLDDERAYSLNEIAINWNAPLVFLLAAANS